MNTELSEEAKQRNKELIAGINSRVPQLNEYAKIGKTFKVIRETMDDFCLQYTV